MNKRVNRYMPFVNLAALLGVLIVNFLANYLPLNDKTTAYISDQYPNLFVPAGFTFSVWGLIYLLLGMFVYYQIRSLSNPAYSVVSIDRIGWLFLISSLANMAWIFTWHYEMLGLSVLVMLTLLLTLTAIYLRLQGCKAVNRKEHLFTRLPFSVYLGWITVATIANITAYLVFIDWQRWGLSDVFWTVTMIIVATGLILINLWRRGDLAYGMVLIWTLIGVMAKRLAAPAPIYSIVFIAAACILAILAGAVLMDTKRLHVT